ncbi:hypothetical protein Cni_G27219 [Canna indica]|uniref:S-type anion channel SLAH1 n=1 Tax=Canna indica TaxID=4628 RepID=A0AAQ3L0T5_9LILI|nr:hypothetical protein Cni_G27219 [Canna indica]
MEGREHNLPVSSTKVYDEMPVRALSKLTGFHAGYFRISLSLCSQALLWKTLSEPETDAHALRAVVRLLPSAAYVLLWSVALAALVALCLLYALRCAFKLRHVRAEFSHHVGVNYLFAPWISWLLLLQSTPARFVRPGGGAQHALWWVFVAPILLLDVKIYGQCFTKGKKILSMVANPTSQITVIGNLVGARAAAMMGWEEMATCMFSLGMAHYLVLFVTLYQRFVGSSSIPAMLRPVFFLFIAAPSTASLAWDAITGSFGTGSKMLFFLSLFLFASLVSRPALFKRSMKRFNVVWWAYSFPLTVLAMAATEYAQAVKGGVSNALMLILSVLSVIVTIALIVFTAIKPSDLLPHGDDPFAPLPRVDVFLHVSPTAFIPFLSKCFTFFTCSSMSAMVMDICSLQYSFDLPTSFSFDSHPEKGERDRKEGLINPVRFN